MGLNDVLEPLLRPLLDALGPFWALLLLSLFISLLTTLVYKYTTDQRHLRSLKADMKRYQNKIKQHKDNPEKALKIQKDVMKLNGEYMKHSFRSTLYTFLPIILFFTWLQANLAFAPLLPGDYFMVNATFQEGADQATLILPEGVEAATPLSQDVVNNMASWRLKGAPGNYDASVTVNDEEQFFSFIISDKVRYEEPLTTFTPEDSLHFSSILVSNKKLLLFTNIPIFQSIPWIKTFGWFGAYFLFSIVFSTALRRALKLA